MNKKNNKILSYVVNKRDQTKQLEQDQEQKTIYMKPVLYPLNDPKLSIHFRTLDDNTFNGSSYLITFKDGTTYNSDVEFTINNSYEPIIQTDITTFKEIEQVKLYDDNDILHYANEEPVLATVEYNSNDGIIKLTSNWYPNHEKDGKLLEDKGVYAAYPVPQDIESTEIKLLGEYTKHYSSKKDLISHLPTFGDVGYIGRPNDNLPEFTHWNNKYNPKEIIKLDPMPAEAWDGFGNAFGSYDGLYRINILGIVKNSDNAEFLNFKFENGQSITDRLGNDSYYAHTTPQENGGFYHYHGFKSGEMENLSNKVIGYAIDGYAIMGQGTTIFKSIFDDSGIAINFSEEEEYESISGWSLLDLSKMKEVRESGGLKVDKDNNQISNQAPGLFHLDYEWVIGQSSSITEGSKTKHVLDKYNMGFVKLNNRIEKVYVCTYDYPYTLHSLYDPLLKPESDQDQEQQDQDQEQQDEPGNTQSDSTKEDYQDDYTQDDSSENNDTRKNTGINVKDLVGNISGNVTGSISSNLTINICSNKKN